jgi:uncharacterized membrane protein YhaH (DUF805 family)
MNNSGFSVASALHRTFVLAQLTGISAAIARAQDNTPNAAAGAAGCAACGSLMALPVIFFILVVVLNIALLVWVARDAKARGMDNAVLWMILVLFTSVIGLVIYIFARPQGNLIECSNCHNKKLQAAARCPHCGV